MLKVNVTKVAHFTGHRGAIYNLSHSIHENCVYSTGNDALIVEWDTIIQNEGKLIADIKKPVYSLLADSENNLLYCGTGTGNFHVIDLKTNTEIKNLQLHQGGIFDIKQVGEHIVTCGGDGVINILKRGSLELIQHLAASDKSARSIAVSECEIAVGFSDNFIRVYDSGSFDLNYNYEAHSNSVFALSYNPAGYLLVSGGRDALLKLWDVKRNYDFLIEIPAHLNQVKCIAFNPSGNVFATTSMDKTIKLWDAVTFDLIKVIDKARNESHGNCINKILWLDDTRLVSCGDDKVVMGWELRIEN